MSASPSRRQRRASFELSERVLLLEDDMDMSDGSLNSIEGKVDRLTGLITGVLITLATSTILLGLNLTISRLNGGQ